ncbi:MAG: hypothetical protein UU73_C0004G0034 [Candidatus Daviesbacteria bacterium GW2011_GWA1_41_61]|uniref:Uncharacterized protein n=1 Tax=Candidatus Daviesbacteria bacterium GW2011_GWA2_40_9 TaxID=1618424 RepID=A0A0G0U7V5_9BACT|nr:MAG: hypothetical protein UU29_C0006G0020 [Candidatus Daviesbacteria bacterium GW2011_GWA2_40_9]KKR93238.1 MAG: hypothetical protein UU44_C0003G0034 [Candidatus Daviesbacteria bacterium GW2011_GWB1_41_15]KKS14726.1 MAG: hypothetical protein UU73_C0004G0034 [Candidatus Daviesbacteria bacterium GW2011_GWA1_41_61]
MNKTAQAGIVSPLLLLALAAMGVLSFILVTQFAPFQKTEVAQLYPKEEPQAQIKTTGSGAPSGTHYNLNIIGAPKGKTASLTESSGHRIFVPLTGSCKIKLSMGDFAVLDGNCTDGPASFQLPSPDPDNDGITTYSVWVRALGKPGGKSTMTPCATYIDPTTGVAEEWCSTSQLVSVRTSGKQSFSDVSKLLLYVYVDLDGDGTIERYPLFDPTLQDYFWSYDNQGLKLLQMRFYPIPSNVN